MRPKRYTNKDLIAMLQSKADRLNKTPTAQEVDDDKMMPASMTYINRFGSWNHAVRMADLEPVNIRRSEVELIYLLQEKASDLGKPPTSLEIEIDPAMPTVATYQKAFGSWNKALIAAGLRPNFIQHLRQR